MPNRHARRREAALRLPRAARAAPDRSVTLTSGPIPSDDRTLSVPSFTVPDHGESRVIRLKETGSVLVRNHAGQLSIDGEPDLGPTTVRAGGSRRGKTAALREAFEARRALYDALYEEENQRDWIEVPIRKAPFDGSYGSLHLTLPGPPPAETFRQGMRAGGSWAAAAAAVASSVFGPGGDEHPAEEKKP